MTDLENTRVQLQKGLLTMRGLVARNLQTGMLPILQKIGQLQVDARNQPEDIVPSLVERYGSVFATLRAMNIITADIYERYFAQPCAISSE